MPKFMKDWSILIFANGNNDLEPEIYNAKLSAETVGSNQNVNVVMQIGREDRNLARILRPFEAIPDAEDEWKGVRRYLIGLNGSDLIETLCSTNMADAASLYNFIIWAAENFPAKHYMLLLGGHGYQFVGCMTDYSGTSPYIMGITELCNALDLACRYSEIKIDLLLMDTCYFNFIEVLYELGKIPDHGVKYMMTYIINGPLVGIPYNQLISIVQSNYMVDRIESMAELFIEHFNYDLIAFKIDWIQLRVIKERFNDLAKIYVNLSEKVKVSLPQMFMINNTNMPYSELIADITTQIRSLIIRYRRNLNNNYPLINVANKATNDKDVIMLYSKLGFSNNNCWTGLLYNNKEKPLILAPHDPLALKPVIMSPKAVYAYISVMNPLCNTEGRKQIFINLVQYKAWKI